MKNPQQYGYTGEEKFEISSGEFQMLRLALEKGLQNGTKLEAQEVIVYLDAQTGEKVENPSREDIEMGKITLVTDKQATFAPENIKFSYDMTKISREMLLAQEILADIHLRNVESGVAKHVDELKPKFEKVE